MKTARSLNVLNLQTIIRMSLLALTSNFSKFNKALCMFIVFTGIAILFPAVSPATMIKQSFIGAGYRHNVGLTVENTAESVGGDNTYGQQNVESFQDIKYLTAGGNITAGIKNNGTCFAVGDDSAKQLRVSNWTDICQISVSYYNIIGLKCNGRVVASGADWYGQKNVWDWTDIVQVAAGYQHTVGLKSDGTVVAVGSNAYGQLNVSDWQDIVMIAAGNSHTVGLTADGRVLAVGEARHGALDVGEWTDIRFIAAGDRITIGIKNDGTVVNTSGFLDTAWLTDVVQVAGGANSIVALCQDGTVFSIYQYRAPKLWTGMKVPDVFVRKGGSGNGTIIAGMWSCGVGCTELSVPYSDGASMQFQVIPDSNSIFEGWQTEVGTPIDGNMYINPGEQIVAIFGAKQSMANLNFVSTAFDAAANLHVTYEATLGGMMDYRVLVSIDRRAGDQWISVLKNDVIVTGTGTTIPYTTRIVPRWPPLTLPLPDDCQVWLTVEYKEANNPAALWNTLSGRKIIWATSEPTPVPALHIQCEMQDLGDGLYDFGIALVGNSKSADCTLTNLSDSVIETMTYTLTGKGNPFKIARPTEPIEPQSSVSFEVKYVPMLTGIRTEALPILENYPDTTTLTFTGSAITGGRPELKSPYNGWTGFTPLDFNWEFGGEDDPNFVKYKIIINDGNQKKEYFSSTSPLRLVDLSRATYPHTYYWQVIPIYKTYNGEKEVPEEMWSSTWHFKIYGKLPFEIKDTSIDCANDMKGDFYLANMSLSHPDKLTRTEITIGAYQGNELYSDFNGRTLPGNPTTCNDIISCRSPYWDTAGVPVTIKAFFEAEWGNTSITEEEAIGVDTSGRCVGQGAITSWNEKNYQFKDGVWILIDSGVNAPNIQILSPFDGSSGGDPVTVTYQLDQDAKLGFYVDGTMIDSIAQQATGTQTYTFISLSVEPHTLMIKATNTNGTSNAFLRYTVLPPVSLSGEIQDTATNKPVEGAMVTLVSETTGESRTDTTHEDGGFEILDVLSGSYMLRVKKTGYGEYGQSLLVTDSTFPILIGLTEVDDDIDPPSSPTSLNFVSADFDQNANLQLTYEAAFGVIMDYRVIIDLDQRDDSRWISVLTAEVIETGTGSTIAYGTKNIPTTVTLPLVDDCQVWLTVEYKEANNPEATWNSSSKYRIIWAP